LKIPVFFVETKLEIIIKILRFSKTKSQEKEIDGAKEVIGYWLALLKMDKLS